MCFSASTFERLAHQVDRTWPISKEDWDFAAGVWKAVWPLLDHSKHYCMSPYIVAAELNRLAGRNPYEGMFRFKEGTWKGDKYRREIDYIWSMYTPVAK